MRSLVLAPLNRSVALQQRPIPIEIDLAGDRDREYLFRTLAPGMAHLSSQRGITEQTLHRACKFVRLPYGCEQSGFSVYDGGLRTAAPRANHWQAACHGFEDDHAEPLFI
jgi:hypothetical protein